MSSKQHTKQTTYKTKDTKISDTIINHVMRTCIHIYTFMYLPVFNEAQVCSNRLLGADADGVVGVVVDVGFFVLLLRLLSKSKYVSHIVNNGNQVLQQA